ncbi:histidine phosphatase family protein [Okibacterium endophyticum]
MTILFLARHGETVWHVGHRYAGVSDIELDANGESDADDLAAWAATAGLDAIYSSPLKRAVLTAEASAIVTGLKATTLDDLTEVDFGEGEGRTLGELREAGHEDAVAAFVEKPAENPLPGGERGTDAIERWLRAFGRIKNEHPDGRVLVVGHGTALRLVLCRLIGVDPNGYRALFPEIGNCALAPIELDGPRGPFSMLGFNLPPRPGLPIAGAPRPERTR